MNSQEADSEATEAAAAQELDRRVRSRLVLLDFVNGGKPEPAADIHPKWTDDIFS